MQVLIGDPSAAAAAEVEAGRPMELLLGNAVKPLGQKSMGTVWMHHFGDELAAVKWITLDDDPPNSAGYTAKQKESMMIREIDSMSLLKHPNIVSLLGVTSMATPSQAWCGRSSPHGSLGGEEATAGSGTAAKATIGIVLELCHFGTLQVRCLVSCHVVFAIVQQTLCSWQATPSVDHCMWRIMPIGGPRWVTLCQSEAAVRLFSFAAGLHQ
jgi:serine/threonine protein kinase